MSNFAAAKLSKWSDCKATIRNASLAQLARARDL